MRKSIFANAFPRNGVSGHGWVFLLLFFFSSRNSVDFEENIFSSLSQNIKT